MLPRSKMAVGATLQYDSAALPIEEFRRFSTRNHHADRIQRHAGALGVLYERFDAIFGDRAQDLIIVAAGDQCFDCNDA